MDQLPLSVPNGAAPPAPGIAAPWLVVVDHHEARLYRSLEPSTVPQQIRPQLGQDFFEPLAGLLNGAEKILVVGNGRLTGGEMEAFIAWLKRHRPELCRRIVGSAVVPERDETEGQLLATARDFYDQFG